MQQNLHICTVQLHQFVQKVSSEFNKFYARLVCVMINWKETPYSECKMRSVVWFLTIENNSGTEIHCSLCAAYKEENVMNLKLGTHWFNRFAIYVRQTQDKPQFWRILYENFVAHSNYMHMVHKHESYRNPSTLCMNIPLCLCRRSTNLVCNELCLLFAVFAYGSQTSPHLQTFGLQTICKPYANALVRKCVPFFRNIQQWKSMFQEGKTSIQENEHKEQPSVTLDKTLQCVCYRLKDNHCVSITDI